MFINFGRLLMLCVWGFMLLNLLHPFQRPLNIFVNMAMMFMVMMHGLQVTLLKATQLQDAAPMSKAEQTRIFLYRRI